MRLELRRIEGEVSGPKDRKSLQGIAVAAVHGKKAILWRVMAPNADEVERVTKIVTTCNKMIRELGKQYPELNDPLPETKPAPKKYGKKRNTDPQGN